MKVSCTFDKDTRALTLTPEDELERLVLQEIAERTEKGSKLHVGSTRESLSGQLIIELKVNGH